MNPALPISNPVVVFALVSALILLAPIVMGRWRLPGMIGLLIAGAALGPNGFGVLARDPSFILFGTVGLLYIMFTAALEIDLSVLRRYRSQSLVFGLMTFAVPMSIGLVVGHWLLGFDWPAAILLASTFASHTLLTYPIVSRLGITRNRAVTTAVGGTIITDTLALMVLAVIAGSVGEQVNGYFWQQLIIGLVAYVTAILFGLPILARWFFRSVGRDGVSEFVFVLAAVFGCAALSHLAGSEPIVGAFLAGLALNRLIPHQGALMNRIQFTGEALFIPFFLLSVGMLLDLGIFAGGPRAWLVAGAMSATVLVSKWLAAESTRSLLGYSRDQARVVFGLSVPQAAATLAATLVGYNLGLFDDAVVNGAILMIFVTCFIAPFVVERHGRALALTSAQTLTDFGSDPQRLLVGCRTLQTARPLLDLAVLLRDPAQKQPIFPLAVVQEGADAVHEVSIAENMLAKLTDTLTAAEVPAQALTRIDLNAASGIIRARRELRATAAIVGWKMREGPRERFFGSMLEHLLRDRHYTLVVHRAVAPVNTIDRIVLAFPPNAELEAGFGIATELVANLVRQLGASVIVIAEGSQEAALRKKFQGIKPLAASRFHPLLRWTAMRSAIGEIAGARDLVVIYGVRPGGLAWEPLLASLPTRLAAKLPNTNLLVVYPPEPREEREEPAYSEAVTEIRLS